MIHRFLLFRYQYYNYLLLMVALLKEAGEENKPRAARGGLRDGMRGRGSRPRARARGYYGRGRGARSDHGPGQESSEGVQEDGPGESRGGYRGRPFRGRRGGRSRGARPRSGEGLEGKVSNKFSLTSLS